MRRASSIIAAGHAHSHGAHVNVTPMIDIVMVLIVFFLLVGQLALDRKGDVDLPESASGERADPAVLPISIAVEADGTVRIDGAQKPLNILPTTLEVLRRQRPGSPVQIRADRTARYAGVRAVLNACREAGIEEIELAAALADDDPAPANRRGGTP